MKYFLWLLILGCSMRGFGTTHLQTSTPEVVVPSYASQAGSIRVRMTGLNMNLEKDGPYFLRVEFATTLAQTLVDIESDTSTNLPISLALWVEGQPGTTLVAPPDSVQIIRWRRGEDFFWLKINSDPSTWLNRNGQLGPPTEEEPVYYLIGVSGKESYEQVNPYYEKQQSNLPSNIDSFEQAQDTRLFVNSRHWSGEIWRVLGKGLQFEVRSFTKSEVTTSEEVYLGWEGMFNIGGDKTIGIIVVSENRKLFSHITAPGGIFHTQVSRFNPGFQLQPITLIAYDQEGNQTGYLTEFLEPKERKSNSVADLFPDIEVSYLEVDPGSLCKASLGYVSGWGELASPVATVQEKDVLTKKFFISPNRNPLFFDGLAVVNMGKGETTLKYSGYDEFGNNVGDFLDSPIAAGEKKKMVLDEIYSLFPELSTLSVESTQEPIAQVVLRGSRPGPDLQFLSEVQPLVIPYVKVKEVEKINIEDPRFKDYLVRKFDTLQVDGEISLEEALLVTTIKCDSLKISSLNGIENFENLTYLDCSNNRLTTVPDLSSLTKLVELNCGYNRLTTLSGLRTANKLSVLKCYNNQLGDIGPLSKFEDLTILYVDNNRIKNFSSDDGFKNLAWLSCGGNLLRNLDVSNLPSLEKLSCDKNELTQLRVSEQLEFLFCAFNQLTQLELAHNINLNTLDCHSNKLRSLALNHLLGLESLDCAENQLGFLDLSTNTKLKNVSCGGNGLTSLDLKALNNLRSLNCKNNLLSQLNVQGLLYLSDINCSQNQLTALPNVWAYPSRQTTTYRFMDCRENRFDPSICDDIEKVKNLGWYVRWNPQYDGSNVSCPD